MDFDFKHLEIFKHIVELKSFTKAAEAVFLTQASVSERVATFEEQLGTRLLDRLPRDVVPTVAGRLVYEYANKLLALRDEMLHELKALMGRKTGTIRIGGSTVPGEYILPKVLSRFLDENPNISLKVEIGDSKEIRLKVAEGLLDLGVVGDTDKKLPLEYRELWEDEIVLAVSKGHRLFGQEQVSLEEVRGERFVTREEGSGTLSFINREFSKKSINMKEIFHITATLGSTTAIKEAVISGVGTGLISLRAIRYEVDSGLIWPCKIKDLPLKRFFYLAWDPRRTYLPVVRDLKVYLIGLAGKQD